MRWAEIQKQVTVRGLMLMGLGVKATKRAALTYHDKELTDEMSWMVLERADCFNIPMRSKSFEAVTQCRREVGLPEERQRFGTNMP